METLETPQPRPKVDRPLDDTEPKSTNWPGAILVALAGFGLLASSAYAGYWYGTQQVPLVAEPTPVVSQPTPILTPTPTSVQASWRKISSARCGFEVRYQDGWSARETRLLPGTDNPDYHYGCVDVLSPDYDFVEERKTGSAAPKEFYIKISRTRLGSEFKSVVISSLESYIKSQENIFEPPASIDYSAATFGLIAGKEYSSGGFQSFHNFIFRKGDYIFRTYWPTGHDGGYGDRENIDQILSTFKFLD